ncbi:hypothetical protein LSAT2_000942 [Lamellibrachia satsuma]|nr:hypothetical protein LSAT2_000942 [Lamellibrachia satsuma]
MSVNCRQRVTRPARRRPTRTYYRFHAGCQSLAYVVARHISYTIGRHPSRRRLTRRRDVVRLVMLTAGRRT